MIFSVLLLGGLGCLIVWIIVMASVRGNGASLAKNCGFVPMTIGVRLSLIVCGVGLATAIAPIILPRSTFGELGHGDGMGLIGLIMFGAVVIAAGIAVALIAAFFASRKVRAANTDVDNGGETE